MDEMNIEEKVKRDGIMLMTVSEGGHTCLSAREPE